MNLLLETYAVSDTGKIRVKNEDRFLSTHGDFGSLFVVCDGIGGHSGGEIASQLAVDRIKNHFESIDGNFNAESELIKSIILANETILDAAKGNPVLIEMGSTVTMLLINNNSAYTANLGDSRIYFTRYGAITQLTTDHSYVQELIDDNVITEQQAKEHPKRNIITRSLGIGTDAIPDTKGPIQIIADDSFVLCSDGLTGYVEAEEINSIVKSSSAKNACINLVNLANERGGADNTTIIVIKVHPGG